MIDVAFTAADAHAAEIAVVVDVLRATTTATQALASGYRSVICVDSLERALELRAPGRVLAGEQECVKPSGFDTGNSPGEAAVVGGDELVLATTNGAPAIVAAAGSAEVVLLGSLVNLDALLAALRGCDDVQVVCAGTDGAPALEDIYLAGRISAALTGSRTDSARVAEAVARAYPTALDALEASVNAQTLVSVGLIEDIELCARESTLDIVPRVTGTGRGTAVVGTDSGSSPADAGSSAAGEGQRLPRAVAAPG